MLRHPDARLLHTGMGPERARVAAARALAIEARAVAIAGVCAGVSALPRAGDVVCADELRRDDADPVAVPAAAEVAHLLHLRGFRVHVGPLLSLDHVAKAAERDELAGTDTLAVDMESAWLAAGAAGRPLAVTRVVADAAGRQLADPRMAVDGTRALATLWKVSDALVEWARAQVPHEDIPSRQTAGG
jgi:4-hydroxy-3-methylbut-2-enyl diphosphate reductase